MDSRRAWWGVLPVVGLVLAVVATGFFFTRSYERYVEVTVSAERAGLVMDPGAKVKLRGVQVGFVGDVVPQRGPIDLALRLDPEALRYLPANVEARISASTAFGAKFVDLVIPDDPSAEHLSSGAVIPAVNVATEVNTVFENLVGVLDQVQPAKLNAVLTAFADGVRGQGERIGRATSDADDVLLAVNPRMGTVSENWKSLRDFTDAYSGAADDIMAILDNAAVTSETLSAQAQDLNELLFAAVGFGQTGADLLGPNKENLVSAINDLAPTTSLLNTYQPTYRCLIEGSQWLLDHGGRDIQGGDGKSIILDMTLLLGDDPYRYPENLPVIAAKGGPGGKPGCGSLPDVAKRFPVRQLITNTGWGPGLDIRPNPGIGHPWWVNFLPVTRAVPEPPSVRGAGPPAIGPVPYPGAPPYGAPLYGPDGAPLWGTAPGP
ncbi:MCE family protein [Mycolicibacterium vaccae]|uniref:MCE family protein n=1 Tax=Mycolicibacterium vaccae TaxID=1810 RepID=UPI003CEA828A